MPLKSSPQDQETVFPDGLIDNIASAIGIADQNKKPHLARQLRNISVSSRLYRSHKLNEPPSQLARNLRLVESKANVFLKCLDLDADDQSLAVEAALECSNLLRLIRFQLALRIDPVNPEWAIRDGFADQLLASALENIVMLRNAASSARLNVERKIEGGKGGRRHEVDWALEETTWQLLLLYKQITGRDPGASVVSISGRVDGPTIRFLQLCLPPLGWTKSAGALRNLIRRVKNSPFVMPSG